MSGTPPPADLCSGYCVVCGEYGRGTYNAPINSHSDTIRDHVGCAGTAPDGVRSRHLPHGIR
ncbi:hypothetical protein [Streptomyces sp. LS1784]|uniref:hypothetical protein n=1 Tax=Streptomyces sp. LS1784 TaxID=2851533 RepID=UPI001CCF85F5|nr:hypothetical protein [Streptomyces sp. LS1784]